MGRIIYLILHVSCLHLVYAGKISIHYLNLGVHKRLNHDDTTHFKKKFAMLLFLQLSEYKQIHTAADCCRSNGGKVTPWNGITGNGYYPTPDRCEEICDWTPGCLYFSHSTKWENCGLCSKCDFTTTGNGKKYTSWERTRGMWPSNVL